MLLRILLGLALLPALAQAQQNWSIGPFTRPTDAPVLSPNPSSVFDDPISGKPVHWEALHTFNPAAIVRNGKIVVLYRAEDDSGSMQIGMHTSRLGMAESSDGLHFTRMPGPVFYPAKDSQQSREWPGGVEDPRLVESPNGTYVLTYTQWNRKTYTIGVATSPDLIHWTKHGPALGGSGPYANLMYKSGGILTEMKSGRLIAAKVHGMFWMYWGEIQVRLATSPDLIHWTPVEDSPGHAKVVLENRPGHFDSGFPEVGPPPILTSKGILLVYNGKNANGENAGNDPLLKAAPDPKLQPGAYAAGQVLFDVGKPTHLLNRLDQPSLYPEKPYEQSGQYAAGTTFAEGLVQFKGKWFLYYGTADSFVGVATAPALN